jgi:hypothetical protein
MTIEETHDDCGHAATLSRARSPYFQKKSGEELVRVPRRPSPIRKLTGCLAKETFAREVKIDETQVQVRTSLGSDVEVCQS